MAVIEGLLQLWNSYVNDNLLSCFLCLFTNYLSSQIQWDEPATIQRPERVSPWDIEPFAAPSSPNLTQQVVKSKRLRPVDIPTSGMWE